MKRFLTVNQHTVERVGRVVVGLGLVWAAMSGAVGAWGYIGVVPLLTGASGRCPLYAALGFSTCPIQPQTKGR